MSDHLTFITGNTAKAEQLKQHLDFPVQHHKLDLTEIQSLDLSEIVEHKAKEAYKQIHTPVLVEDVALTFSSMGKLPGPLIKWFLLALGNKGLCKLLNNYQYRSAVAEVRFGLYDGKIFKSFSGKMKGTIAKSPKGNKGFGWDPIFIPHSQSKTWAEMAPDEQSNTSMRRIALKKLKKYLVRDFTKADS